MLCIPDNEGRIVAAGYATGSYYGAGVMRLTADGKLDSTFAMDGDWRASGTSNNYTSAIAIQPDGKILVGTAHNGISFQIYRLNPNGTLDGSFGNFGKASITGLDINLLKVISNILLDADGKIVFVGHYGHAYESNATKERYVGRLLPNGTVDASFHVQKLHESEFNFSGSPEAESLRIYSIIKTADDGYLISLAKQTYSYEGWLLKLKHDGSIDESYGTNGKVNFPSEQRIKYIYPLSNNQILMVTDTLDGTGLKRYSPDGVRDYSYGINGCALFKNPTSFSSTSNGVSITPHEDVILFDNGGASGYGYLARMKSTGVLDSTFGVNGVVNPANTYVNYRAAYETPDGKLIVSERYSPSNDVQGNDDPGVTIARYLISNSVGVIQSPAALTNALIYPNPVSGQSLSIAYELPASSVVQYQMLDMTGRLISTDQRGIQPSGSHEDRLNIPADLKNGYYLLNIQTDHGNSVVRIMVQRD